MSTLVRHPTYSKSNPNGRATSDEPRRKSGPEPACADPAWVAAVMRFRTAGLTIEEVAGAMRMSASHLKGMLSQGRGSEQEPYHSFANEWDAVRATRKLVGGNILNGALLAMRKKLEMGDPLSPAEITAVSHVHERMFPESYGSSALRQVEQEPTSDEAVAVWAASVASRTAALVASADQIVRAALEAGWAPSDELMSLLAGANKVVQGAQSVEDRKL